MPKWRQDRETGELRLVDSGHGGGAPRAPAIVPDIEPFVSPVDGRLISSRTALRAHNEEHGVAQHREYGDNEGREHFERANAERVARLTGQTERDRRERLAAIIPVVERYDR